MIPEVIAEVKISYSTKVKASERRKITCSSDVASAFRIVFPDLEHVEYCYMMLLNRKNAVLGCYQLSKGGMTGTVIDVRVALRVALKACATSIILAHNHPSGNLDFSEADRNITRQLKEAGSVMDIPLLDHIVITEESYISMADEGLL
jgi:DNA repair protein RadC